MDKHKASVVQDPELRDTIQKQDAIKWILDGPAERHRGTPEHDTLKTQKQTVISTRNWLLYAVGKALGF